MYKMDFFEELTKMITLTFIDAKVIINLNGTPIKLFSIKHKIFQRCMIAPYFFIIIDEALNAQIHDKQVHG